MGPMGPQAQRLHATLQLMWHMHIIQCYICRRGSSTLVFLRAHDGVEILQNTPAKSDTNSLAVVRQSTMTLVSAFLCDGACGSLTCNLGRKNGHTLHRRTPAFLLLGVSCAVAVCAQAFLLPFAKILSYVLVQILSPYCRKLHAIRLGPWPIHQVWRKRN